MINQYLRSLKQVLNYNKDILQMCMDSVSIYDQSLYFLRQEYFRCRDLNWKEIPKYPNFYKLYDLVKETDIFKNIKMDYNIKLEIIKQVSNVWKTYIKIKNDYKKNPQKYNGEPKMPKYKYRNKKSKYNIITINYTRFRGNNENYIIIPCTNIKINISNIIKKEQIIQLKINIQNNTLICNFIYNKNIDIKENKNKGILSIDLGISNLITGFVYNSKINNSFIIRGTELKQKIKDTNNLISYYQSKAIKFKNKNNTVLSKKDNLLKFIGSKKTNKIYFNYNNFSYTYMHTISNMIKDYCLQNNIVQVIIGYNKDWQSGSKMRKDTNKVFCSLQYSKLIKYIEYKCQENNIIVNKVEESYTSKCDHLVCEQLCKHDIYLGKRKYRGLFESSCKKIINADINGAIGIMRKLNVIPDIELINLRNRGDIVSPVVLNQKGFN